MNKKRINQKVIEQNNDSSIFKDQIKVIRKLVSRNTVFSPEQVVHNDFAKFEKVVPKNSILYRIKTNVRKYDTIKKKAIFTPNDRDLVKENLIKVYEYDSPKLFFSNAEKSNFENLNSLNDYNYYTLNTEEKNYNTSNYIKESPNIGQENFRARPLKKLREGMQINNTSKNNKIISDTISPYNTDKNFNDLEYNTISPVYNNNLKINKKNKNYISQPQISTQFNNNSNIINIENNIFGYSEYDKKIRLSTDLRSTNNNNSEYSDNRQCNTQSKVVLNEYGSENSSEYFEKMKLRNISDSYKKYSEKMQVYRKKLAIEFLKHFKVFLAYYLQRLFVNLARINSYDTSKSSKKYLQTESRDTNNKSFASIDRYKFYKNKNYSKLNFHKPKNLLTNSFQSKNFTLNSYQTCGSYAMKTFDKKQQKFIFAPYKRMKMLSFTKAEENSKIQIGNNVIFKNNSLKFNEVEKANELCRNSDLLTRKYEQIVKRKKIKNSLPKNIKFYSKEYSNGHLKNNLSLEKNLDIMSAKNKKNENVSCSCVTINRNSLINKNVNISFLKEFKKEPITKQNKNKLISMKCSPCLSKEDQSFNKINQTTNISINTEKTKKIKDKGRLSYNYKQTNPLTEKNKNLNQKKIQYRLTNYEMNTKVYKVLVKNIHTSDKRINIHINYYFFPQNKKNNKIKYDNITKSNSFSIVFIRPNKNVPSKKKKNNTKNRLSLIKEEDPSIRDSKIFEENESIDINNYINEINVKNTHKNKSSNIIGFCGKIINFFLKKNKNDFINKLKKIPSKTILNKNNCVNKEQLNYFNPNDDFEKKVDNKIYVKKRRIEPSKKKNSITMQKLFLFRDLLRGYVLKRKNKS